jgi:hypothetical protein
MQAGSSILAMLNDPSYGPHDKLVAELADAYQKNVFAADFVASGRSVVGLRRRPPHPHTPTPTPTRCSCRGSLRPGSGGGGHQAAADHAATRQRAARRMRSRCGLAPLTQSLPHSSLRSCPTWSS